MSRRFSHATGPWALPRDSRTPSRTDWAPPNRWAVGPFETDMLARDQGPQLRANSHSKETAMKKMNCKTTPTPRGSLSSSRLALVWAVVAHREQLPAGNARPVARSPQLVGSLGCVLLATVTGCTTLSTKDSMVDTKPATSIFDRMPWSKSKDGMPEPYPNPVKLAATWTPDTLTQVGRVPTRGFGARVFFYDEKSRPVPVEGTLRVHAFDEGKGKAKGQMPLVKRYEFTPEQFTRHFSNSDLGASYSVWIPWDAVGGDQTRVSLVASFTTAEGKTIQGSTSVVLLPGAKESAAESLAQRYSPDYRQWQAAASGSQPPTSGLTTTTIRREAASARSLPETALPSAGVPNWNVANSKSSNSLNVAMKSPTPEVKPADAKASFQTLPASSRTHR
ncbi:hypothetical protein Poly21_06320 [Allorhodopirellula heiligendammensis]|uniref:Uncharacterized protein n=2 Tax=Allorhodopirellula heiligendammensis TaxID=2714739 RepID=A0A5C6C6Q8_9BACT|nr:hypothetical protein Poly21_06320 [Allorhodopirellula heiligendammensis]